MLYCRNPPLVTFDYLSYDEFDLEIVSNLSGKQLYELFDGVLVYMHASE